jgi:hypothetical protein
MGDRDVRRQPSPVIEEIDWLPAIANVRGLDVNLFVRLSPAPQAIATRDLCEKSEGFRAVTVNARGSDSELKHAIRGDPFEPNAESANKPLRPGRGSLRIVTGAAPDENKSSPQIFGHIDSGERNSDCIGVVGPDQMMVGDGGHAAEERLAEPDRGRGGSQLWVNNDAAVGRSHNLEPLAHGNVPGLRDGTEG